jgi:hypothetical protein
MSHRRDGQTVGGVDPICVGPPQGKSLSETLNLAKTGASGC